MRKKIMLIAIIVCLVPITIFFIGGISTKNKVVSSNNNVASDVTTNEKDTEEPKPIEVKDTNTSSKKKNNYNSPSTKTKDNSKENTSKKNNEEPKTTEKSKTSSTNKSEQYNSKNLGFTINFPESWKGHYEVVEKTDFLRVSFKPSKQPLAYEGEGVLFMILKKTPDLNEDAYDTVGSIRHFEANGVTYLIGGPLDFPMEENHPEVKKYREMMKERPNVLKTLKNIK